MLLFVPLKRRSRLARKTRLSTHTPINRRNEERHERVEVRVTQIWMPPGEYLRQCREAEGVSQRKLAHRLGLSHVFIGAIERGEKRFPLDRCEEFAGALPWTFRESEMRRLHPWGDLSHRWGHEWAAVAWMASAAALCTHSPELISKFPTSGFVVKVTIGCYGARLP